MTLITVSMMLSSGLRLLSSGRAAAATSSHLRIPMTLSLPPAIGRQRARPRAAPIRSFLGGRRVFRSPLLHQPTLLAVPQVKRAIFSLHLPISRKIISLFVLYIRAHFVQAPSVNGQTRPGSKPGRSAGLWGDGSQVIIRFQFAGFGSGRGVGFAAAGCCAGAGTAAGFGVLLWSNDDLEGCTLSLFSSWLKNNCVFGQV